MSSKPVSARAYQGRDWSVWIEKDRIQTFEQVMVILLVDIRDHLQKLNALLHCQSFLDIPYELDTIRRNTTKKRKKKPKTRGNGKVKR